MTTIPPLFLALLLATSGAAAADKPAEPARVMTLTRTAVLFSGLELRLDDALRGRDTAALDSLVSDDFELRESSAPGQPVPRAEWLKRPAPASDLAIGQLGVHDFGDTAVVSFAQQQVHDGKAGTRSQRFIVDVWRKDAGGWRLVVRYQPAAATTIAGEDTAPSGKG